MHSTHACALHAPPRSHGHFKTKPCQHPSHNHTKTQLIGDFPSTSAKICGGQTHKPMTQTSSVRRAALKTPCTKHQGFAHQRAMPCTKHQGLAHQHAKHNTASFETSPGAPACKDLNTMLHPAMRATLNSNSNTRNQCLSLTSAAFRQQINRDTSTN
jgi:hypothetical protein